MNSASTSNTVATTRSRYVTRESDSRHKRFAMRQLRRFSKPTLVEYIASRESGFPCDLKLDLLYLISLRNALSEQEKVRRQALVLRARLVRAHAIKTDGDSSSFVYPPRNGRKLVDVWRRYVSLCKSFNRLAEMVKLGQGFLADKGDAVQLTQELLDSEAKETP